ncbi:MAG TPA: efflux RND transporter periplasmic adaptor subunit [Psychromonas hadalis]|nr:efflux RND transporter periplasmic adaptor subunit [Psychromonas hadalis]
MNKKQIFLPILVIAIVIGGYFLAISFSKPPEEKPAVDNTPIVEVMINKPIKKQFMVATHGIVSAQFETKLVAQVSGEIVYVSTRFERGAFVKKGAVLAKVDNSDYQSDLLEAKANAAAAKAALVKEKALADVAKAQRSHLKNDKPTPLSLHQPQVAEAKAKLLSAQAKLKRAKRNLQRTVIKAPYDALIARRTISQGSYVSNGSELGQLFSTKNAQIRLPIAEHEFQFLENIGIGLSITLSGNVSGELVQWQGKIVRSEGVLDQKSRMNYLVAEIPDPYVQLAKNKGKQPLRYGAYVSAEIKGNEVEGVSVVARHLLTNNTIAIVDAENKIHFQPVHVVRIVGSQLYISEGLEAGMKVVTSAIDYPLEGMKVKIRADQTSQKEK